MKQQLAQLPQKFAGTKALTQEEANRWAESVYALKTGGAAVCRYQECNEIVSFGGNFCSERCRTKHLEESAQNRLSQYCSSMCKTRKNAALAAIFPPHLRQVILFYCMELEETAEKFQASLAQHNWWNNVEFGREEKNRIFQNHLLPYRETSHGVITRLFNHLIEVQSRPREANEIVRAILKTRSISDVLGGTEDFLLGGCLPVGVLGSDYDSVRTASVPLEKDTLALLEKLTVESELSAAPVHHKSIPPAEAEIVLEDPANATLLPPGPTGITTPAPKQESKSKGVREGETIVALYEQLKRVRSLYRDNGWTSSSIRAKTAQECACLWEWVERLPQATKGDFLNVREWDDGDKFIFLQIKSLYHHAPHLSRKPEWSTIRDWRKAYKGFLRHNTPDGRLPKP